MQVNSAQDYLTQRKRQIIATTYNRTPPPQKRRNNEMFTSVVGNGATQSERFIAPFQGAPGSVNYAGGIGGATYTSQCCLASTPLALGIVVDAGVVRFNVIPPISVTATRKNV